MFTNFCTKNYSHFAFFPAGNGAAEFTIASRDLIDSAVIPQKVKPIFQKFIDAIAKLKPCVDQANLQCLLGAFEKIGVKGMEKAVESSHGQLQQLFQKMLNLDRKAVAQMHALPEDAGQQAVEIEDFVFHTKANWIQQHLQKSKE